MAAGAGVLLGVELAGALYGISRGRKKAKIASEQNQRDRESAAIANQRARAVASAALRRRQAVQEAQAVAQGAGTSSAGFATLTSITAQGEGEIASQRQTERQQVVRNDSLAQMDKQEQKARSGQAIGSIIGGALSL